MKRGLISEFGGMVLWAIILVVIVVSAGLAITRITTSNQENQAKSTLDRFANFLSDIEEGKSESFVVFSPKNLYFVPSGSLVCICDKNDCNGKKKWCKNIDKPIIYSGNPIVINVGTFIVTKQKDSYILNANIIQDIEEKAVEAGEGCSGQLVDITPNFQLMSSLKPIFDKAAEIAKSKGVSLTVKSAFRTVEVQRELWKANPNTTMVCNPDDPEKEGTCPHQTGCAVDVCFGDLCFSDRPHSQADMQLLEDIMTEAGFVRYSAEYWHFEYGTSRWHTCKAKDADARVCA